MRIVADTNIVVSAFLWGGTPEDILIAARAARVTLYTSAALAAELEGILARPKFARQLARVNSSATRIVGDYLALARLVRPSAVPRVIKHDPDDDQVLACAVAARAHLVVSGDGDLLSLGQYQNIPILTAAQAVERIHNSV